VAAWWRAFDDPALTTLIQRALAANHDIGIAAVRLEEAKAMLGESRQGFLPRGGTALGRENRRRGEVETPAGQPRRTETYRGAVDASWEIDLFGRARRSVEAAQAQAGSRAALLRGVQAGVAAFKAFGAAGDTLRLRLLGSAANREVARLARVRFSAGEGNYLDVLEAEWSDFVRRRALAVARTHQRLAVVSLYKALGGGWEICAQADQDCDGAGGSPNLRAVQ
jgi:multidrug efflux system outer membrane protein